ncbi:unnamed protein product [Lactuca saligna]|uniref:Uncharacterized protein n=1 Tax=Lactuca saligna TaxID=75948 RepID=A0AA35VB21_LACSI|nr:unnamed protein product [Lactuca saligna]
MKEHATNVENMYKAVDDSAEVFKITTEKVDKLISEATAFMENFRTTFDSNTTKGNESLQILGSLFKTERENFQEIETGLKSDHEEFQTSIFSQLTLLQVEQAM